MEVGAVTQTIQWLASQHDAQITYAIILTHSMNLLQKLKSATGTQLFTVFGCKNLLWIYLPGHAGINGNERASRLASIADITSGLQLGWADVLRSLRNFLDLDRPEHQSTDCLKERGEEIGSADIPPSDVGNDLCSTRQTLALFRVQPLETVERRGGARVHFSKHYDAILS